MNSKRRGGLIIAWKNRFWTKMVFLFLISSEQNVVKNFRATQKMRKNLDNALEKTDWKNIEKWPSYGRLRENFCEKLTFSEKYF